MKAQTRGSHVTYYSVRDVLCNAQGCMTKVGEHLTRTGASLVVDGGLGATIMAELDVKRQSSE